MNPSEKSASSIGTHPSVGEISWEDREEETVGDAEAVQPASDRTVLLPPDAAWCERAPSFVRPHHVNYGLPGLRFRGAEGRTFCTSTGRPCGKSPCSLSHTLPPKAYFNLPTPIRHPYNAGNTGNDR
jgi:hypothetical protein